MGDFLSNLSNVPQYAADWWNGKRSINPVSWAWNSLPGNVKDTYTSGAQALVDMSTPASVRDYTTSAQDTARSAMQGDGWGAATGGLGMVNAALGAIPVAGMGVRAVQRGARMGGKALGMGTADAAPNFIRAYHGSPHSFDKFDISKIGTGEGAQAYGHGLYFAENEGVARNYRDQPGKSNITLGNQNISPATLSDQLWKQSGNDSPEFLRGVMDAVHEMTATGKPPVAPADLAGWSGYGPMSQREGYAYAAKQLAGGKASSGSMYEVAIHADPAKFLDWDKAISQQSPEVQKAFASLPGGAVTPGQSFGGNGNLIQENGQWFLKIGDRKFRMTQKEIDALAGNGIADPTGAQRYQNAANALGGDAALSDALKQAGVPGLKYLDAGSRGAGDGSRNFVVFDDSIIEILRKYGLLPAAGAAGFYGATAGDPQQGAY